MRNLILIKGNFKRHLKAKHNYEQLTFELFDLADMGDKNCDTCKSHLILIAEYKQQQNPLTDKRSFDD